MIKIVLDTKGGDNGPAALIKGAFRALEKFKNLGFVLVGDREVREYLALASVKELGRDSCRDSEALKILTEDLSLLKAEAEQIRSEMAADDIFDAVALLEEHIAGYSKELWFLNSMTA